MRARLGKTLFCALLGLLAAPTSQAEVGVHIASHLGVGNHGQEIDPSMPKRSVGTFDLQLFPGWKFLAGSLQVGGIFDYRFLAQLSDSSDDLSGRSATLGIAAAYFTGPVKLMLSRDLWARHYTGNNLTYMGSGWHLLIGYEILPKIYFDLEFTRHRYNTLEATTYTRAIADDPLTHTNFGFGVSLQL